MAQPAPSVVPSLPATVTGAAGQKDEEPARPAEVDTTGDKEIYDDVACTD